MLNNNKGGSSSKDVKAAAEGPRKRFAHQSSMVKKYINVDDEVLVVGEEKKTEEDYEQIDGKSCKLMVHGGTSKMRTAKKMNQIKGKEVQRWSDEKGIEPPVVNIVLGTSFEGKSALGGDVRFRRFSKSKGSLFYLLESTTESQSKSDEARIEDTIPPANLPQDQIWTRELKELRAELKRSIKLRCFYFPNCLCWHHPKRDSVLVAANREALVGILALLSHDAISRPPRPALSPKPHSIHIPSTKYSLPAQMRQSIYMYHFPCIESSSSSW
ncbi:hypothetical protein Gotri_017415 [Gossypium trilobum]|uniref:Uncharacterized protein n=1 Tax=Gossypium trilobum TaxID=34281 RepID=A0A7J9E775_9ROSI|nr:hypothetical protein [Gossypium trilobum]